MNKKEITFKIAKSSEKATNTNAFKAVSGRKFLKSLSSSKVEASSIEGEDRFVKLHRSTGQTHHLLLMLQLAFHEHKPVVISPDHLWLLICQGFAEHLNLHADQFQSTFMGDRGKQKILVRRDDFVEGGNNPWEEVPPAFTARISETIQPDLYSKIVLNFSTTTPKATTAFEISFMDSMSNYFDYEFASLCGIPYVKILGTVEDYQKMLSALEHLKEYDLEWWIWRVQSHIKNIIETINGGERYDFWASIFKVNNESGGPFVTGWITHFFPYITTKLTETAGVLDSTEELKIFKTMDVEDFGYDGIKFHKVIIRNPFLPEKSMGLKLDAFPTGMSVVPFKWKTLFRVREMEFVAGFWGIKEQQADNELSTDINWMIRNRR